MAQLSLFKQAKTPEDVVYTQSIIAESIIQTLKPAGKILDPCKGDGSFYDMFPSSEELFYCEITEGKDFYNFHQKVDWIIGNPPYSIFLEWLQHSFKISDNVAYLVPTNKIFQSWKIMNLIQEYGGIKTMLVYGSGNLLNFPFGFSVGVFHFQRGYHGLVDLQFVKPPNKRLHLTAGTGAPKKRLSNPEALPASQALSSPTSGK